MVNVKDQQFGTKEEGGCKAKVAALGKVAFHQGFLMPLTKIREYYCMPFRANMS
jgi:hypothetical protein